MINSFSHMKAIIETIITLVEDNNLEEALTRTTKFVKKKVKDEEYMSFVIDTKEIFDIAKTQGLEGANAAIDKVINNYSQEIKARFSKTINN
jgi:hypothetical protein